MSEDSIAWGTAEASAPLPPRKRLLAGFKQNGWSPPSSPSSAGPMQNTCRKINLNAGSIAKLEDNLESASMVEESRKSGSRVIDSPSSAKLEEQGEDSLDAGSMVKLDSSLRSFVVVKHEEHDDGSVEHGDRDYTSFAAESMDFYNLRRRKSKRLSALPVVVSETTKKKKVSKAVSAGKISHAKVFSVSDMGTVDAVTVEVSEAKVISMAPAELAESDTVAAVKANEERAVLRAIKGEDTAAACGGDFKPGVSTCSKAKEDESVCCDVSEITRNCRSKATEEDDTPRRNCSRQDEGIYCEISKTRNRKSKANEEPRKNCSRQNEGIYCEVLKPTRNHRNKSKEENDKPRRSHSRQHDSTNNRTDQNRQEMQTSRSSLLPLPLSDEELARQLHRVMNSSPRISHRLSYKEDMPLPSSKCKHHAGRQCSRG